MMNGWHNWKDDIAQSGGNEISVKVRPFTCLTISREMAPSGSVQIHATLSPHSPSCGHMLSANTHVQAVCLLQTSLAFISHIQKISMPLRRLRCDYNMLHIPSYKTATMYWETFGEYTRTPSDGRNTYFGHMTRHNTLRPSFLTHQGGRHRGRRRDNWLGNKREWTKSTIPGVIAEAQQRSVEQSLSDSSSFLLSRWGQPVQGKWLKRSESVPRGLLAAVDGCRHRF